MGTRKGASFGLLLLLWVWNFCGSLGFFNELNRAKVEVGEVEVCQRFYYIAIKAFCECGKGSVCRKVADGAGRDYKI